MCVCVFLSVSLLFIALVRFFDLRERILGLEKRGKTEGKKKAEEGIGMLACQLPSSHSQGVSFLVHVFLQSAIESDHGASSM